MTFTLLARVVLGFLLASAGAAALLIAALYRGASGMTLAAFGLFSGSYGGLILLQIPAVSSLLPISGATRAFLTFAISYAVPGLGLLYAEQIRGPGWRKLLRRFWQAGLPLAVAFIVYDLATGRPGASFRFYEVYLGAALLVLLPHVVFFQHRDRIERLARAAGTGLLAVTLLVDMLSRLFDWQASFETIGIASFVLAQGVVTARRFFADQRELAAVERELQTARTIQTAILPRQVPTVAGVQIAVRYLPARTVAGDLYDFLRVDDARLGVLVADVAGHGVSAALIASMTTVAFASQKPHAAETGRTLTEMNRVLCGHFDSRYVTAAYVFIDTERQSIRYSLAGHPPLLLWRAASQCLETLAAGSLVLGLFDDAVYPTAEVPIEPGDRLIAYTDGVAEVQNRAGVWFGDGELERVVRENAGRSAEGFCDALVGRLAEWSGINDGAVTPRFADDLTLVVVDWDGRLDRARPE